MNFHSQTGFDSPTVSRAPDGMPQLNILHVMRAPVGGLLRHVLDLTRAQIARGHRVGIIADSQTGSVQADETLRVLEPSLALGLSRVAMQRHVHPADAFVLAHVMRRIARTGADVVHGHGAKGGAYARLALAGKRAVRAYTPHGGSLLFSHDSFAGAIYLTTERFLMRRGDLFLFASHFSKETFYRKIGEPRGVVRVVHNGVAPAEFEPVTPSPDATDLIFIGELRQLKGVDLIVEAINRLRRGGREVTATLVGAGPDADTVRAQVARLDLGHAIHFRPPMPARQAMALGRVMVMPSRIESLPYVVLEAAAAAKPLITARVGGIPEIYGPLAAGLVPPDDVPALAAAIVTALDDPKSAADAARQLSARVKTSFSLDVMVDGILAAYQAALATLQQAGRR